MRLAMAITAAAAALAVACSGTGGEASATGNAAGTAQPSRTAPAGRARGVADPRAFIEGVYRTGLRDGPGPVEHAYSDRLRALMADQQRDAGNSVGRLDFDYWSNSQDPEIANVRVAAQPVEGRADRRIVVARFTNGGRPQVNRFYFERSAGRWFLDDVRNEPEAGVEGSGWTLSLILKYDD